MLREAEIEKKELSAQLTECTNKLSDQGKELEKLVASVTSRHLWNITGDSPLDKVTCAVENIFRSLQECNQQLVVSEDRTKELTQAMAA